jgi:hypothetical protein
LGRWLGRSSWRSFSRGGDEEVLIGSLLFG